MKPIFITLTIIAFLSLAPPAHASCPPQYSGCDQPEPEEAYYLGIYDACYWGAAAARMTRNEAEAACAYFQDKARRGEWYEQGRGWKRLEKVPVGWGWGA